MLKLGKYAETLSILVSVNTLPESTMKGNSITGSLKPGM